MVNDSPFANPEDRIRDLIMNIEEMKAVLEDLYTDLEADEEMDAAEILELLDQASEGLSDAAESLEEAESLIELPM